jgi:hypothetical protein
VLWVLEVVEPAGAATRMKSEVDEGFAFTESMACMESITRAHGRKVNMTTPKL